MHARNFDSTFGGLGVLTSVVWQYTFHFESLHFRFLWSLPPVGHGLWLVPAAVWRLDQAALWNMTLHCTHASSPSHPAVALLQGIAIGLFLPFLSVFFACLCLLWCIDPFGIFFIFDKIAKTRIIELPCDLPCDGEYEEEMTARITGRNEDDWNWN